MVQAIVTFTFIALNRLLPRCSVALVAAPHLIFSWQGRQMEWASSHGIKQSPCHSNTIRRVASCNVCDWEWEGPRRAEKTQLAMPDGGHTSS